MHSYSLFELNEYIKRVIALNFNEPIWVNAEISQVTESRGQVYIDLIEHDERNGQTLAQSNAIIWYKSYLFIRKKLGDLLPSILKEGSHVLLKVSVEFNERYGLKLMVTDIDASYTIGQMEMARKKILERIEKDGLIAVNKDRPLPAVIQHIAVVSSERAAGYQDFKNQLLHNSYGYQFRIDLYPSAMQGLNVERGVVAAIKAINEKSNYDCIAIIRGGGSKLDLSYFDNYNIAATVAKNNFPVITGIGHDIDQSVTDIVSRLSLKTPTAVADFILERNLRYESDVISLGSTITNWARQLVHNDKLTLSHFEQVITSKPRDILSRKMEALMTKELEIESATNSFLRNCNSHLNHLEAIVSLSNPIHIMKKGYAIVKKGEKTITSAGEVKLKDNLSIEMHDGIIKTKVYE